MRARALAGRGRGGASAAATLAADVGAGRRRRMVVACLGACGMGGPPGARMLRHGLRDSFGTDGTCGMRGVAAAARYRATRQCILDGFLILGFTLS